MCRRVVARTAGRGMMASVRGRWSPVWLLAGLVVVAACGSSSPVGDAGGATRTSPSPTTTMTTETPSTSTTTTTVRPAATTTSATNRTTSTTSAASGAFGYVT